MKKWQKFLIIFLVLSAAASSAVFIRYSLKSYFLLDDFTLLVESQDFPADLLRPILCHFRPVERLHFALHKVWAYRPWAFYLTGLLLHFLACAMAFLLLRRLFDSYTALTASLLLLLGFPFNETLFWISAAGVSYSFLFSAAAIYFFEREKYLLSMVFTLLAALSYETWVVLPAYFLVKGLKKPGARKALLFAILLAAGHLLLFKVFSFSLSAYGGLPPLKQIPLRIIFYLLRTFLPFSVSTAGLLLAGLALLLLFWLHFRQDGSRAWLAAIFYFVPAFIFLFSAKIASRFFYFPYFALSLLVAGMLRQGRRLAAIGGILILYLAFLSPAINYLDSQDYLKLAAAHRGIVKEGGRMLASASPGDVYLLLNCFDFSFPRYFAFHHQGRNKLIYERKGAIGGLIFPHDLVNFILMRRGLWSLPQENCSSAKVVKIGGGRQLSSYCFKVIRRGEK